MIDYSTIRWKVANDSPLDSEEKEVVNAWLGEKLGYPPPSDEKGESGQAPDAKEETLVTQADRFKEYWVKGASFGNAPNERKGVIFHHADGYFNGTIDWLTKHNTPASYHVLIDEDGTRCRFVDDGKQAWHAGYGSIHGRNPNHVCLGVAFVGDTVGGKYRKQRELNELEIESAMEFIRQRWEKFGMSYEWVTDHRTVDPKRRNDLAPDQLQVLLNRMKKEFK